MALQTTTQIYIAGTPIQSYVSLDLKQEIDAHHSLELVCRTDVVERFTDELIGESKDFLGGVITIQVSASDNFGSFKELEFKGVITGIQGVKAFHNTKGDLVTIYAKSTSIITDDGPHYTSYSDVSLSEILDQTLQGYDQSKLETNFSPTTSEAIHYSVQHNQSTFSYLSRLAAYHNQWFYDSGKQLVFGKPSDEETILTYGSDLMEFALHLEPTPNNFSYFTNDYLTDEQHQKSSKEVNLSNDGYQGFMDNKSRDLYNKETKVFQNIYTDPQLRSRFDKQIDHHTQARAAKQVIAKGISDNPGVNLGEIIKIDGYGRFRITKISHSNVENGQYKNEFEAIDANLEVYPKADMNRFPKSESQVAVVTENSDPNNLGRIKVQFPWQVAMGQFSPWLRMVTPHAGGEKGFHFIPEVGEEVICQFEGGNAERPYVAGSLYNGSANPAGWNTAKNDIKAIRTRSGHTITMDDTKGGESITVEDKNNNKIFIDTANNNITVSANETMTFNAKNIEINADENINVSAGKDMTNSVAENYNIMTKNNNVVIEETISVSSKKQENISDEITLSSNKQNLTLASGKTIDVQSKEKVKLF